MDRCIGKVVDILTEMRTVQRSMSSALAGAFVDVVEHRGRYHADEISRRQWVRKRHPSRSTSVPRNPRRVRARANFAPGSSAADEETSADETQAVPIDVTLQCDSVRRRRNHGAAVKTQALSHMAMDAFGLDQGSFYITHMCLLLAVRVRRACATAVRFQR